MALMETSASAVVIPSQVEVHLQLVPDREDMERQRPGPLEATFVARSGSTDAAGVDHRGQPGTEERTARRESGEKWNQAESTDRVAGAASRPCGNTEKMLVASSADPVSSVDFIHSFPHWAWALASAVLPSRLFSVLAVEEEVKELNERTCLDVSGSTRAACLGGLEAP